MSNSPKNHLPKLPKSSPKIMPGLVPQLPRPPQNVEAEINGAAQGGLVTDLIGG